MARLKALGARIVSYPENFALHPRVAQVMANRVKMLAGELPLDWGCAETLAYASILEEGNAIRFTGQDAGRGTFFHRHAVLHEQAHRRALHPAAAHRRAPALVPDHRLGALRRSRARVRIRILDHRPVGARDLGRRSSATS